MNKTIYLTVCVVWLAVSLDAVPVRGRSSTSLSRGSSSRRGSSSSSAHSYGQQQKSGSGYGSGSGYSGSASGSGYAQGSGSSGNKKPSSAWDSWAEKPKGQHSYPSSQTGLSGGGHRSSAPNGNQQSHGYPASTGLSGQSGKTAGSAGYPQQQGGLSGNSAGHQQTGLSGSGTGSGYPSQQGSGNPAGVPPQYSAPGSGYPHPQGAGHGAAPPPYSAVGGAPPPYSPPGGGYQQQHYGTGGRQNMGGAYPNNNYHQGQAPPPYSGYGGPPGVYHQQGYGSQMPGYFGNSYGKGGFGGMSRGSSALTGVGIAGAGVGTLLTGLALWNLARSTGRQHHTVIYDNRGQPIAVAPENSTAPVVDPMLADLVNCTLTVDNGKSVEILAIPCAIATSFTPEADVKDSGLSGNSTDNTKCTITIVTKQDREFMTTIPCSTLLNTAAENNVTEPAIDESNLAMDNTTAAIAPVLPSNVAFVNGTAGTNPELAPLLSDKVDVAKSLNCTLETGDVRDPINPCFSLTTDVSVIPLQTVDTEAPGAA